MWWLPAESNKDTRTLVIILVSVISGVLFVAVILFVLRRASKREGNTPEDQLTRYSSNSLYLFEKMFC